MDNFFILREAPEAAQNPRWLKQEGIRSLQELVGKVWSHYNDVDPGVTLLEHLCWALSEVAYCADFPLEDLLAGPDGSLAVPNQFPNQADILSHQPVNNDDVGKLLFDRLPDLRALKLTPEYDAAGQPTGRQHCHLAAQPELDETQRKKLNQSAWQWLRRWRIPGQDFLPPTWLTLRPLSLSARLLVRDAHQASAIAETCRLRLDQFAAPVPRQNGYHSWQTEGLDGAQIIDGPHLEQGWIPGSLPELPQSIRASELAALLAGIDGVEVVLHLQLIADTKDAHHVRLASDEIIDWTLDIEFLCNEHCCFHLHGSSSVLGVEAMKAAHAASGIGAGIDLQAPIPQGHYRNLAEYYPVQATLPPNWGLTGREVDKTTQQHAQTRQLQGYLMPFEQLLTNQLAQLAHVGELFSPSSQPPSERSARPEDIAWQPLARTSFSQPLYQIPDIEALIAGQQLFDVWLGEPRPQVAWRSAREFSHNPYRHALTTLSESEHEAMQRRLNMLRHLLARHGEESADYDAMILACQWYGSRERTLTIIFSLWLQNLSFLSEARCCGARYPAPSLYLPGDPAMTETCTALIAHLSPRPGIPESKPGAPWWQRLLAWPEYNGQPDLARIEALATLDDTALDGMSSFELKAGLLLDLSTRLWSLAAQLLRALNAPGAREWLRTAHVSSTRFTVHGSELYLYPNKDGLWLCDGLWQPELEADQALIEIAWPTPDAHTNSPMAEESAGPDVFPAPGEADEVLFRHCHAHVQQLLWLATQRKGFLLIEPILLKGYDTLPKSGECFSASLFWPNWVLLPGHRMAGFIDTLRQRHWPAHITLDAHGASFSELAALIPAFVAWHNEYGQSNGTSETSARLADVLNPLTEQHVEWERT